MRPDADPRGTVDDLLELYAIDALDSEEAQLFESALLSLTPAERADAVGEIRSTRDAVGRMAAEFATVPSAEVRARILAAIETDGVVTGPPTLRSVPTADFDAAAITRHTVSRPSGPAPEISQPTDELSVRRINRRRRVALSVTSAAAAVILVFGGVLIGRSFESSPAPTPTPTIAQADPMNELRTVMSAQDAEMHRTKLTGMSGTVVVASSRRLDTAVVLLDGAPQPPNRQTYQLWLIGNNHPPKSAGLVNGSTNDPLIITGLSDSRTVGMTVEPTGGSPQPTGAVLAAVTF